MRYARYILWLLVIILALAFTILNAHWVEINYYFGKTKVFFPLILLLMLIIGAILGYLAAIPKIWKVHRQNRQLKRNSP